LVSFSCQCRGSHFNDFLWLILQWWFQVLLKRNQHQNLK
jgi:hypothetical protein